MFRNVLMLSVATIAIASPLSEAQVVRNGDILVTIRNTGTVLAIDPQTGDVRGAVSGVDVVNFNQLDALANPLAQVGNGPDLESFNLAIDTAPENTIICRTDAADGDFVGLVAVDPFTGDRMPITEQPSPFFTDAGDLRIVDETTIYTTNDDFVGNGDGANLLLVDPTTGEVTLISGHSRGDGPAFYKPRALEIVDADTILVCDFNLPSGGSAGDPGVFGTGLFLVDIASGDRTFLSRLTDRPMVRTLFVDGEADGTVTLGDDEGGSGPVGSLQTRSLRVVDGVLYAGVTIEAPLIGFTGGIITVDLTTGDRTLVAGDAFVDNGMRDTVVRVSPPNDPDVVLDVVMGMTPGPDGLIYFTQLFVPGEVRAYDPATGNVLLISDVLSQLNEDFAKGLNPTFLGFNGLAFYQGSACAADFNIDGTVDLSDFGAFGAAFNSVEDDAAYDPAFDFDNDSDVDLTDFGSFASQFNETGCLD